MYKYIITLNTPIQGFDLLKFYMDGKELFTPNRILEFQLSIKLSDEEIEAKMKGTENYTYKVTQVGEEGIRYTCTGLKERGLYLPNPTSCAKIDLNK